MESELRKMDYKIDREVFGHNVAPTPEHWPGAKEIPFVRHDMAGCPIPRYTTSEVDALAAFDQFCNRFRKTEDWEVKIISGSKWGSQFICVIETRLHDVQGCGDTRPLAICCAIEAYLDWKKEHAKVSKELEV